MFASVLPGASSDFSSVIASRATTTRATLRSGEGKLTLIDSDPHDSLSRVHHCIALRE